MIYHGWKETNSKTVVHAVREPQEPLLGRGEISSLGMFAWINGLKYTSPEGERRNTVEPLKPTEVPEGPWMMVGTDLATIQGKEYRVIVDYYSWYSEVFALPWTESRHKISRQQNLFGRLRVPEVITSSPKFPQSNGQVEPAVKEFKNILFKAGDLNLELLASRATPAEGLPSPAELLMGRRLCTTVPTLSKNLCPKTVKFRYLTEK